MRKICFSKDWYLSAPGTGGQIKIDLPNDYSVTQPRRADAPDGGRNGSFVGGVGYYTKYFTPEAGKHMILDFDGAYCCAEYYLNDEWIATHPHGYTPFLLDITPYIAEGVTNKISVITNDMQPSTRWYSGAGIYRDVFMWTGGDVRVEPWDVFITTPKADAKSAEVSVAYEIAADRDATVSLVSEVRDAEGKLLTRKTVKVNAKAGEKTAKTVKMTVKSPRLWDMDDPYLHTLVTRIEENGNLLDDGETAFGIRSVEISAERGFVLNGRARKLRGGCIHHDHGVLGAASFPAAEARKVRLLKEAGFNALRIAHNPPSLALLEVCDLMGIIVMDEAFDMWNRPKTPNDYHLFFADWCERDISYMVKRDRNHPCVLSYSIGNEIIERDGNSDGIYWAEKLIAAIKKYDTTRPTTSGIQGFWTATSPLDPPDYAALRLSRYPNGDSWQQRTEKLMSKLDIAGYNYQYPNYESDHERYPDRVMWGSETHTLQFFNSWSIIKRVPYVLGDFTWTAIDNLGEAAAGEGSWARDGIIDRIGIKPYPWRTCWQGDLDLCGYRRPQAYFREAIWIGGKEPHIFTTHPVHNGDRITGGGWHFYDVCDTWTYPDEYLGTPVRCEVYTDADEIAFILNGKEVARATPEKAIAAADIPYEKGTLTAVSYRDGKEESRFTLETVGAPAAVRVEAERTELAADRRDLAYFRLTVTDKEGRRVPNAMNELYCLVTGGELMGIFSADPKNEDQYGSDTCHAFEGRALLVVRTGTPGTVTVSVGSKGLRSGSATVLAKK